MPVSPRGVLSLAPRVRCPWTRRPREVIIWEDIAIIGLWRKNISMSKKRAQYEWLQNVTKTHFFMGCVLPLKSITVVRMACRKYFYDKKYSKNILRIFLEQKARVESLSKELCEDGWVIPLAVLVFALDPFTSVTSSGMAAELWHMELLKDASLVQRINGGRFSRGFESFSGLCSWWKTSPVYFLERIPWVAHEGKNSSLSLNSWIVSDRCCLKLPYKCNLFMLTLSWQVHASNRLMEIEAADHRCTCKISLWVVCVSSSSAESGDDSCFGRYSWSGVQNSATRLERSVFMSGLRIATNIDVLMSHKSAHFLGEWIQISCGVYHLTNGSLCCLLLAPLSAITWSLPSQDASIRPDSGTFYVFLKYWMNQHTTLLQRLAGLIPNNKFSIHNFGGIQIFASGDFMVPLYLYVTRKTPTGDAYRFRGPSPWRFL